MGQAKGHADGADELDHRAEMMRVMEIGEALQLNDAETIKLRSTLAQFDETRRPLHKETEANVRILRRAARGDATVFGQVDTALQRVVELRSQIQEIDRQLFKALSKGLDPQRKARLALVMARLSRELRALARGTREDAGGGRERGPGRSAGDD